MKTYIFMKMSRNHFDLQGHFDLWPSDSEINRGHLLVMTSLLIIICEIWKLCAKGFRNHFNIQSHCEIDLWPSDSKINSSYVLFMSNNLVNMKNIWSTVFKKLSGNRFDIQCYFDLDLWPSYPKFNRGQLLVMIDPNVKYKVFVIIRSQDNQQKTFNLPTDRQT